MPTQSAFADVYVPNDDLWGFMFDRKNRNFPDDQVIYRDCNSDRKYTFAEVKQAATAFGEGLWNLWDWQSGDVLNIHAPNDIDLSNSGSKAIVTTKACLPNALKAAKAAKISEDRIILLGDARDETHRFKHWTNIRKTSGALRYRRRKAKNPSSDLAFLVYSSGTTGLPKGVMLTHTNIVANLCQVVGSVGASYQPGKDKILGVLPFFHIYGLTGLVQQPLHRGVELVVMPGFDLKLFLESIQSHRITFVYVAPPVIVRLARADKSADRYDLSSVRMMTSGAAPLTRELVDTVHRRYNIKINQAYGLSETSPMTHTQPWDEWQTSIGSVGKIFPNMTAKYISAEGEEVVAGQTGELWMAGPNVFRGYWKNEAATRDCIVEADGQRYFKTGDVGFQDENHNFFITDRVKELIKYKGFQVAPAELEGKLMDHPLVNDVAVIGVYDNHDHTEVPRAYIVHARKGKPGQAAKGDSSDDATEIARWLGERVAHHKKLRGGVRFIDEIPKGASGKILRRVLKEHAKKEEAGPSPKL